MVQVAGYGRWSADKHQITPDDQREIIQDWFDRQVNLKRFECRKASYLGMFVEGMSAKGPLFERPVGQHLLTTLWPGDVIVAARLDRVFRSEKDAERSLEICATAGLKMVFADVDVDANDYVERARVLSLLSPQRCNLRGELTKEALMLRRAGGKPSGRCPVGWKIVTRATKKTATRATKKIVPDIERRRVGFAAREMFRSGLTRYEVFYVFRRHHLRHGGKRPLSPSALLHSAAAACIGFPRVHRPIVSAIAGMKMDSQAFIRADPAFHSQIERQCAEYLEEERLRIEAIL